MADIRTNNNSTPVQKNASGDGVASLVTPPSSQIRTTNDIKPQAVPQMPSSKTVSSSPWDEVLPETISKPPTIVGTLDDQEPLQMPTNIEEKVGQKVPATEFMSEEIAKKEAEALSNTSPEDWDLFGREERSSSVLSAPDPQKINLNTTTVAVAPPPVPPVAPPISDIAAPPPAPPVPDMTAPPVPEGNTTPFSKVEKLFSSVLGIFKKEKPPLASPMVPIDKSRSSIKNFALGFLGVAILFIMLVFMTEMGILSLGLEKIYGSAGLEKLWGGLPLDAEQALAYGFVSTKAHPNYKVKGTIDLRIDSSVDSQVTLPLVSMLTQNKIAQKDRNVASGISAINTASDVYTTTIDGGYNSYNNTNLNDTNDSNFLSDTTPDTDSSKFSETTNMENTPTTAVPTKISTVSDVSANVSLKIAQNGTQAKVAFKKNDQNEELDLINIGQNLYVKGTSEVNYGAINPTDFVKYQFNNLKEIEVGQDIFDIKNGSGLKIEGTRVGNEIAAGVRCYSYKIDSIDVGEAFSDFGITSNLVQTVSGQVWLGIRDKAIRRIKLKITTPITSSVTMINLDLSFSEYGITNKLDYQSEIINAVAPMTTYVSGMTNTSVKNDSKRKSDVDTILKALAQYKAASGSYPLSSELLKLDMTGNIIETALVPKYLTTMPLDPIDGWYYAYKSADGTSCSLSARLENQSDTNGQLIGDVYLYLKYSN